MASQTSTPARRGVLSPLNVNATIGSPSIGGKAGPAAEPQKFGETFLQSGLRKDAISDAVRQGSEVLGAKRWLSGGTVLAEGERPSKRSKGDSTLYNPIQPVEKVLRDGAGVQEAGLPVVQVSGYLGFTSQPDAHALLDSSSAPSSPTSSNGTSEAALNDSQLTVPDDSQIHTQTRVVPTLTLTELRQKAQEIKLRLRLASYKVRTNQVHVPMSRLEIRTIGSKSMSTSRIPQTSSTSLSDISNNQVQNPSAEKARQNDMSCSPPPKLCNAASIQVCKKKFDSPVKIGGGEPRDGYATPLLPRHREGLLNPPKLGRAIWDEMSPTKELTSSVVKRGTADALLSLKHQR
ncbi:hypothetical protein D0Z07_6280 [Hyphodiscus hymeniophilus]|uniref:Uncharacterized protein n=1 Tax=Hyphodiscus hymeniophilus TaxID=353542 RepID=A0A9P7AV17_9HELO|nr:hypothetical protein D0Z07_6280 [Hyphodiscus hymeniophilus]